MTGHPTDASALASRPGNAANPAQPLHWNAEGLWQALLPLLPGLSVEVLPQCDSTNTRLLERARLASAHTPQAGLVAAPRGRRTGDAEPALLVAEHQTAGRGRLGREWQATAGASLCFSLAMPCAPARWQGLSLAVGLALAEALEPLEPVNPGPTPGAPRVQLKWPNDLWLVDDSGQGRKLGGVLIETVGLGTGTGSAAPRMLVVGVGLNVLPQSLKGLSSGYACAQELLPGVDAPALLHRVATPLVRALLAFQQQGFAPLAPAYARRDLLRGRAVSTTLDSLPEGVAEGVDEDGALRVCAGGRVQRVSSGEVSIRLQAGAGQMRRDPPC